jgi:acyl carrier protein
MNSTLPPHAGQLALISTFFEDVDFDRLARDRRFQEYVVAQKSALRSLLLRGYALATADSGAREGVPALIPMLAPMLPPVRAAHAVVVPASPGATHAQSVAPALSPAPVQRETALDGAAVLKTVTDLCAAKTGYPLELLEPALDLEADLGIDTIKQMELIAAVRAHYAIPKIEGYALKQTPTLAAIADFVLRQTSAQS